jgi:FtsP/CotA-like multicopper oxidase with cupredoxin domain
MTSGNDKERPAMRALAHRKTKVLIALAAAAVLAVLPIASAPAVLSDPDVTIDLCATTGTLDLPGGVSVPVWGFTEGTTCAPGDAQVPGPLVDVAEGQIVQIVVHNNLAEPVSLEVPGATIEEGAVEAPAGGSASYRFASAPGTYVYQSPSAGGRQIGMGLYGALIVRPATPNQAYDDPATAYDSEQVLVLSALDPALNADPDGFDMLDWAPPYWLINGAAYPDTAPISAAAGDNVLLRYVNAGSDNTSMALLGAHERVVAKDAYPLASPFDAVAETIPAGATMDAIVTIPASGSYPLYNRQLHLTNGTADPGDADAYPFSSPGGMMTFVQVP